MSLPVIIDAASAMAKLRSSPAADVLLLDCRFELTAPSAAELAYRTSHVEGSVYAHVDRDLSSTKLDDAKQASFTGRHPLPDRAAFAQTLGRWGVTPRTHVFAFDAHGAPYAARAWWLLRWMGHTHVHVVDGGLPALIEAGASMTQEATMRPSATAYPASIDPAMPTISAEQLLKRLGACQVVDARAADRFRGENETLDPIAGHIPGARNRFFRDNLTAQGHLQESDLLKLQWHQVMGSTNASEWVHQCGSGVTACQNLMTLAHLGFGVGTLYPGSWSEWSADSSRPIAKGS